MKPAETKEERAGRVTEGVRRFVVERAPGGFPYSVLKDVLHSEFAAVALEERSRGYLAGLQEGYRSAIEVQLYRACARLLTYWLTGAREGEAMTEDVPLGAIPLDQLDGLRKLVLACEKPDQIFDLAVKAYFVGVEAERGRNVFVRHEHERQLQSLSDQIDALKEQLKVAKR
jgi:hypothetical protein